MLDYNILFTLALQTKLNKSLPYQTGNFEYWTTGRRWPLSLLAIQNEKLPLSFWNICKLAINICFPLSGVVNNVICTTEVTEPSNSVKQAKKLPREGLSLNIHMSGLSCLYCWSIWVSQTANPLSTMNKSWKKFNILLLQAQQEC